MCRKQECICDKGFSGLDCSEKECLNECSGHGICVKASGMVLIRSYESVDAPEISLEMIVQI